MASWLFQDWKPMKPEAKQDQETQELAVFFLRFAHKNGYCLRLNGPSGDFVFKPVREGFEQDESWVNVDLNDKTINAIKPDRRCGTSTLHKDLIEMDVPHEFDSTGAKE